MLCIRLSVSRSDSYFSAAPSPRGPQSPPGTPILLASQRIEGLLIGLAHSLCLLYASSFKHPSKCVGDFLLLFIELRVGSWPAWPQTALQIMLLLISASLATVFRCFQIGGCSEIELKVKAVTGSVGVQLDIIAHINYTSQGLRPRFQEEKPRMTIEFIKLSLFQPWN